MSSDGDTQVGSGTKRTIAIYGGSFSPPHNAHVMVARSVSQAPGIDALWVMPAFAHALDKVLIDFVHRLRMCELAFADIDKVTVIDIERELGDRSRMVRTLRALTRRYPDAQWRLVIGSDLVDELPRWSEPDAIRMMAPLWIVQREGSQRPELPGPVFPAVSSSDIRERVARGQAIDDLVPAAVAQYIVDHQLYAAT